MLIYSILAYAEDVLANLDCTGLVLHAMSLTLGRRVTVVVWSLTLGTKGYGSRFVVCSFVRSVHCATESSAHFFAPVKVRTG